MAGPGGRRRAVPGVGRLRRLCAFRLDRAGPLPVHLLSRRAPVRLDRPGARGGERLRPRASARGGASGRCGARGGLGRGRGPPRDPHLVDRPRLSPVAERRAALGPAGAGGGDSSAAPARRGRSPARTERGPPSLARARDRLRPRVEGRPPRRISRRLLEGGPVRRRRRIRDRPATRIVGLLPSARRGRRPDDATRRRRCGRALLVRARLSAPTMSREASPRPSFPKAEIHASFLRMRLGGRGGAGAARLRMGGASGGRRGGLEARGAGGVSAKGPAGPMRFFLKRKISL